MRFYFLLTGWIRSSTDCSQLRKIISTEYATLQQFFFEWLDTFVGHKNYFELQYYCGNFGNFEIYAALLIGALLIGASSSSFHLSPPPPSSFSLEFITFLLTAFLA